MKKIKKIFIVFFIITLCAVNAFSVLAQEVPLLPEAPVTPKAPGTPIVEKMPSFPSTPVSESFIEADPEMEVAGENTDSTVVETKDEVAEENVNFSIVDENNVSQNNQTAVENTLEQTTSTGGNSASFNVGDSAIITENANTSGTVISAVNTNVDRVVIAEFNIMDDYKGDVVLNFDEGVKATSSAVQKSETFQNNEAVLENNLILVADTGDNEASKNTNGNTKIETGDANVSALVLSFVNNNLAGNVTLATVNIFGNLVGDIILPEEELVKVETTVLDKETVFQSNEAGIENNLILVADTGDNEASKNTGGQTSVETGSAETQTQVVNVANSNVNGGSWWLVIVNEAGEWIGKILGFPNSSGFAGAMETEIRTDEIGQIVVGQDLDGVGQDNKASITNNIELAANTGKNKANDNTGEKTSIKTGDVKIIATLINFVNNNISTDSKLIVAVVNVFGRWIGDFLPPGYKKDNNKDSDNDSNDAEDNSSDTNGDDSGDNNEGGDLEDEKHEDSNIVDGNGDEIVLATPVRLKGGTFVYNKDYSDNYKMPNEEILAAQSNDPQDWGKKPVKVNLAWLTLTVPLFLLLVLVKKLAFS